jgi:predicted O-methyltransferase YrrM
MNLSEWNELIENEYQKEKSTKSDIDEHLHDLLTLAEDCTHVTEFGSRFGASTKAFLKAPVSLRAYDLEIHDPLMNLFKIAKKVGKDVEYVKANTLSILIEPTDLIFIDTWHSQQQLREELKLHGNAARKYLAFHDTHTYGVRDEQVDWAANPNRKAMDNQGLLPAIIEFIIANPQWKFRKHKQNCNGLTILERRK